MNTSMNLFADPIDRDAERVSHDTAAVSARRTAVVVRTVRRSARTLAGKWRVQEHLHARVLHI